MALEYWAGYDVGSETVHAVALDREGKLACAPPPFMHFGNALDALREARAFLADALGDANIKAHAFTGASGKLVAEATRCPYWYDTLAIPKGAGLVAPGARYVVHVGARDPYFFEIDAADGSGIACVSDHATGTKCGGGSGILINKQARRFFAEAVPARLSPEDPDDPDRIAKRRRNRRLLQEQLERIHLLAEAAVGGSDKLLDVGGRCGVIIQSDMIHMQNSGERIPNILAGMYSRIVRNYRSDVLGARTLDPRGKAVATGGVFRNARLLELFSAELGLALERPDRFTLVGAGGAAAKALEEGRTSSFDASSLELAAEAQREGIAFAPPLSEALGRVVDHGDETPVRSTPGGLRIFRELSGAPLDVVIGMDGGSTTTKALVAEAGTLGILAEICLDTDGKPLETAQRLFSELRGALEGSIRVRAIAYTGSSGAFYHKLFTDFSIDAGDRGVDLVKDEITCHAAGVRRFDPRVDTIFECGGQDAKFTVFGRDGNVKKAKMNLSCMAGTGQSMKNMLDMLGFDFATFDGLALSATRTPVADEMCAIFTEAGVLKLLALGFPKEEIAAAIAYGFMGGYANKFVGSERFGEFVSAQGGPFKGRASLAALALHTGTTVNAFPHRQLFGAFGAAVVARERLDAVLASGAEPSLRFKGFGLADLAFAKRVEPCSKLVPDSCGIRDCRLQVYSCGDSEVLSGGLCPKGNTGTGGKRAPDYIGLYKGMLEKELAKYAIAPAETAADDGPRVLIPRSLHFLNERAVLFAAFFRELGFTVVVSPESDDAIADLGVSLSHSEACYPSKLHNGHAAWLLRWLRPGVDKLFLANFLGRGDRGAPQGQSKTCPYVSGAGFAAKEAIKVPASDALLPLLVFDDPLYPAAADFSADFRRAYAGSPILARLGKRRVAAALRKAEKAQAGFLEKVYERGEEIVARLSARGERVYVGIGRGYTLFDDKASSRIHELFMLNGLHFVPAFFLRRPETDIAGVVPHMYWYQGREMSRYALRVALDEQLYGVRETNFNCGPDAMLSYHETRLSDAAGKPWLTLQTDGHNSNAQFGTRTLAFDEVARNHEPRAVRLEDLVVETGATDGLEGRLLGIPDMGTESAEALAAVFASIGYRAEVMPTMTRASNFWSRKYLITNNCLPMHILFGDAMAWVKEKEARGLDPGRDLALFIPMAGGPCRLGQYHVITRQFLDQEGYARIPIVNPAAYLDWENLPIPKRKRAALRKAVAKSQIAADILYDARLGTRPYELEPGATDEAFAALHVRLLDIVARGGNMRELLGLMEDARAACEAIPRCEGRKPLVGLFGEIYVRSHPGANEHSIRLLERHGLEVAPRLIADMLEYNNRMQRDAFLRERRLGHWIVAAVKGLYMRAVEKRLGAPFEDWLAHRVRLRPFEIYSILRENGIFDIRIKGEAGISIGTTYNLMHGNPEGLHGVYHLEPFGCMQECVATAKIRSLIDQRRSAATRIEDRIVPYMVAVFGDSELPNLEAEIAMFAEKCRARRDAERMARGEGARRKEVVAG